jgi:predicted GIY-YIG superfamily endonuclease
MTAMVRNVLTTDAGAGRGALTSAADRAPTCPGVYLFLGQAGEVLYVGKARNLRRRIRQHAGAGPPTSHLHGRYALVRQVCWEIASDEETAAWREGELIFALRPPFNSDPGPGPHRLVPAEARAPFLVVTVADPDEVHRFTIVPDRPPDRVRVYGCFPHLGKGVSSRIGIACSDGYAALLRLLWAASGRGTHMPSAITRSAPQLFEVAIDPAHVRPLHGFLSGVGPRLLDDLALAVSARPPYMQPGLARDRKTALGFFSAGPRTLRAHRLRHGLRKSIVEPEAYRALVIAEVYSAMGQTPAPGS